MDVDAVDNEDAYRVGWSPGKNAFKQRSKTLGKTTTRLVDMLSMRSEVFFSSKPRGQPVPLVAFLRIRTLAY